MSANKEQFVESIRHVHKSLRKKYRAGNDFDRIWKEHSEDDEALNVYAKSMLDLATMVWDEDCDGKHRIKWCLDICREYFREGGLKKILDKDRRRKGHYLDGCDDFHCGPNPFDKHTGTAHEMDPGSSFIVDKKLDLLDVGSCYDPFRKYNEFLTVAVDLKPACKTVYQCDFLKAEVETIADGKTLALIPGDKIQLVTIPAEYFNVVVFSLLLTYIPSPFVRWQMCGKAHRVLKTDGLLLIITPDSSHQNKNAARMKRWKLAIERIGFQRVMYSKDKHLHFMAFRKVPGDFLWDYKQAQYWKNDDLRELHIPQDFQESSDEESEVCWENDDQRRDFVNECLSEMPGFDPS